MSRAFLFLYFPFRSLYIMFQHLIRLPKGIRDEFGNGAMRTINCIYTKCKVEERELVFGFRWNKTSVHDVTTFYYFRFCVLYVSAVCVLETRNYKVSSLDLAYWEWGAPSFLVRIVTCQRRLTWGLSFKPLGQFLSFSFSSSYFLRRSKWRPQSVKMASFYYNISKLML